MKSEKLFSIALLLIISATGLASLTAVRYLNNEQYHAVYSINETTGTGSGSAYVGNVYQMNCMASDNKGNVYSIGKLPGNLFTTIALINPKNGQVSPTISLDFTGVSASETIKALAWNPQKGMLAIDIDDKLVSIDTTTGQGTLIGRVGTIGFPINITGLAFSPEGRLFGWGAERYGLIEIDPDTASYTDVNPDEGGGSFIQSLEFAPDGSALYGVRDSLYKINIGTGQATEIGTGQGFDDIRGIAFQVDSSLGPKIVYPNGGEMLTAGQEIEIKLNLNGITEMLKLELSLDNGNTWNQLKLVMIQSKIKWTPEVISSNCLLKISKISNPSVNDSSNETFTIYECVDPMPSDVNKDCVVNLEDLSLMAAGWLTKSPARIKKETLDSDPAWSVTGQWQFGTPMGMGGDNYGNADPAGGFTGSNVYGINLDGDYNNDMSGPEYLVSGPFNCSGITDLSVGFRRWINTDGPEYVRVTVDFSVDQQNWINIWTNEDPIEDDQWQFVEYPLTAEADDAEQVYVRWGHEVIHDRAYLYSGWNIDDIELIGQK